jgi:putative redox protein
MSNQLSAQVSFQEKMHFTGWASFEQTVAIDYSPPFGEGAGFMPLELLLLSLAGCSGQTLISLLRTMEQSVCGLEVRAQGQRQAEHPTVFTIINLEFIVRGADLDPAVVAKAIALSEDRFCPVWAMLKGGVTITASFQVIDVEASPVIHTDKVIA